MFSLLEDLWTVPVFSFLSNMQTCQMVETKHTVFFSFFSFFLGQVFNGIFLPAGELGSAVCHGFVVRGESLAQRGRVASRQMCCKIIFMVLVWLFLWLPHFNFPSCSLHTSSLQVGSAHYTGDSIGMRSQSNPSAYFSISSTEINCMTVLTPEN